MRLIPIHPENIKLALKDVEKYILRGLEFADNKYNLEDIKDLISQNILILWVVYNDESKKPIGCLLTELLEYPQVRALSIFIISGDDLESILTLLPDLIEYAKHVGCKKIEFYGRPGWERVMKSHSFEKTHTVMRLNL